MSLLPKDLLTSKYIYLYRRSNIEICHDCMQLASYLEGVPLIWMMLLHMHVNLNTDDDNDDNNDDDDDDDDDDDGDNDDDDDDDDDGINELILVLVNSAHVYARRSD